MTPSRPFFARGGVVTILAATILAIGIACLLIGNHNAAIARAIAANWELDSTHKVLALAAPPQPRSNPSGAPEESLFTQERVICAKAFQSVAYKQTTHCWFSWRIRRTTTERLNGVPSELGETATYWYYVYFPGDSVMRSVEDLCREKLRDQALTGLGIDERAIIPCLATTHGGDASSLAACTAPDKPAFRTIPIPEAAWALGLRIAFAASLFVSIGLFSQLGIRWLLAEDRAHCGRCRSCGYDLNSPLPAAPCPECGTARNATGSP